VYLDPDFFRLAATTKPRTPRAPAVRPQVGQPSGAESPPSSLDRAGRTTAVAQLLQVGRER
jgi:hypothetical protein